MYCSKCGKEISDNSKFCENCGNRIVEKASKDKPTITNKKKVITIGIITIILLTLPFIMYGLIGSGKNIELSRNDGTKYYVSLTNLNKGIKKLKNEWTIENQIGVIDNGQEWAKSAVVLKTKNIENDNETFDSYYYASCIDLSTGNIENIDIQIYKSYGAEYVLDKVLRSICSHNEKFSTFMYGEPIVLSNAEEENRIWCVSKDRGDKIQVLFREDTEYTTYTLNCNANSWVDVLYELEELGVAKFTFENRSYQGDKYKILKSVEIGDKTISSDAKGTWMVRVNGHIVSEKDLRYSPHDPLKPGCQVVIDWQEYVTASDFQH